MCTIKIRDSRVGIRARFRSWDLWVMGPPCGLKSRKDSDILHDHVSKACQRITSQFMLTTSLVPRARDEENHFPARWTRRTNRQSSRTSVANGMSSTIVTGSYWQSGTTRCLHKQGNITAYIIWITRRFKQNFKGISFPRASRAWYPWQDIM